MRILFVAPQNSIHVARWIGQLGAEGWDLHLFPSTLQGEPHPDLMRHRVTFHFPRIVRLWLGLTRRWALDRGTGQVARKFTAEPHPLTVWWLTQVIKRVKPDIIHSLEFQHAGYLTLEADTRLGGRMPVWVAGNWGSDIYLFGRLPSHVGRIKEILERCDFYTCECDRDVRLALEMGLRGTPLPVLPNAGGYDLEAAARLRSEGRSSSRRTILLKGYQGWAGRALVGLRAVELCSGELRDYRVLVSLASPEVQLAAELLAHRTGLDIEVMPSCAHEEMLRALGSARVHIGLSISDAISQSLLEAIVMGTFPIQSCTACVDEWIVEGVNGLVVSPEDPQVVAEALRRALADDHLVDNAADCNARIARERLDARMIQPKVVAMYEEVLHGLNSRRA